MALLIQTKTNNCLYLAKQHYNNVINTDNARDFIQNVILTKIIIRGSLLPMGFCYIYTPKDVQRDFKYCEHFKL